MHWRAPIYIITKKQYKDFAVVYNIVRLQALSSTCVFVRVVKEEGLRSSDVCRVGSNPTEHIVFFEFVLFYF